jgi:hypothetical protein
MKYSSLLKYLLIAFVSYLSVLLGYQNKVVVEMQPVSQAQASDTIGQETKRDMSAIDIDEEEAIRKVEAANTPDLSAQSGRWLAPSYGTFGSLIRAHFLHRSNSYQD